MRRALQLIFTVAWLMGHAVAVAVAEPRPVPGVTVEVVRLPETILSGVAVDGDDLLLTNLADGRLYRRRADGHLSSFGPVLPHGVDVLGDPTGPYRVERFGLNYLVTQGWTPAGAAESQYDHALLEVDEAAVTRVVHGDFWNPFDLLVDGETIFVVDAARNSVERLDSKGEKTILFSFPRLGHEEKALKMLSPTEFSGREPYDVDAVPTGIAKRDGRLFVSLFGGFPYIAGGGAVTSIDSAGANAEVRHEVEGLETPVDLAFDGSGGLLVLEHGRFAQATGFMEGSGRLLRIDRQTGVRKVLVDGLTRPTSLALLRDGRIAVAGLDGTLVFVTDPTAPREAEP
jgi:sugar lactone lactonase YvrE